MSRVRSLNSLVTALKERVQREISKLPSGDLRLRYVRLRHELDHFTTNLAAKMDAQGKSKSATDPLERAFRLHDYAQKNHPRDLPGQRKKVTLEAMYELLLQERFKYPMRELFKDPLPTFANFSKQVNRVLPTASRILGQNTRESAPDHQFPPQGAFR